MRVRGSETSAYAKQYTIEGVRKYINGLDYSARQFHFILALGIYTLNLSDVIKRLRDIQRMGIGRSFVTLAAYDTPEDLELFRKWTLLGTTILKKSEWIQVLEHCHYTGDYSFTTSKTLGLCASS